MTRLLLSPESPEPDDGPRIPDSARSQWLRLKASADREARIKRLEQVARRKPLSACTPCTRACYEAMRDLAELRRNRRRWEDA
jgi:hypothetical protein